MIQPKLNEIILQMNETTYLTQTEGKYLDLLIFILPVFKKQTNKKL